jgi:hypothetical protein
MGDRASIICEVIGCSNAVADGDELCPKHAEERDIIIPQWLGVYEWGNTCEHGARREECGDVDCPHHTGKPDERRRVMGTTEKLHGAELIIAVRNGQIEILKDRYETGGVVELDEVLRRMVFALAKVSR